MTEKEHVLKTLKRLPSGATIEEAMERLYLLYKVERGIRQANAGQKISQAEAKRRMKKWLM